MIADIPVQMASAADAAQIAAMSRDEIEYGLPWGWTERRVARAIASPGTNVVVVRESARVAGFGIMGYNDDDAHLLLLAVRPDRRRAGIASAILGWLEDVARAAGAARIRVEARWDNDAARCFYSEHGYTEKAIQRRWYSGTVDGVLMEKWLRAQA
jgi:ribosomal-protein-alanine N-acetyltransferase